jgi:signal peptidase I
MDSNENLKLLLQNSYVQAGVAIALLLFYVMTKSAVFGLLTIVAIVGMVLLELSEGVKKNGWKAELWDIGITVAAALVAWFALQFVLSTSTPISAVVSCSMVPDLSRGDMIIVKGGGNYSGNGIFASDADAQALFGNPIVNFNGSAMEVNGSMFSYCQNADDNATCRLFYQSPELFSESRGLFNFTYSKCYRVGTSDKSIIFQEPCITSVSYKNQSVDVQADRSSDTIVYAPKKTDLFSLYGDIVHRAVVKVVTENGTYMLTKGDNNNVFDIQFYLDEIGMRNTPVNPEQVKGKILFRIPYLGYYKLFLSFYLEEESVCGTKLIR